jgi:hypothetical protein
LARLKRLQSTVTARFTSKLGCFDFWCGVTSQTRFSAMTLVRLAHSHRRSSLTNVTLIGLV